MERNRPDIEAIIKNVIELLGAAPENWRDVLDLVKMEADVEKWLTEAGGSYFIQRTMGLELKVKEALGLKRDSI
jgi:hypothetical protein